MADLSLDLAFLHEWGLDAAREASADERKRVAAVRGEVLACDRVVIRLGGRAGRLGECVVATALLEGFLLALAAVGKARTPVCVVVDEPAAELFDAALYHARYWPEIDVRAVDFATGDADAADVVASLRGRRILVVDLHGGHDGMPALDVTVSDGKRIAALARLFRTGVRAYAARGPARRYAGFVEDLLGLPTGTVDSLRAQPTVPLSSAERTSVPALARKHGMQPGMPPIVGFFQSVVPAKCYGHWEEVLGGVCADFAERFPGSRLDVVLACGPDDQNPEGVRLDDLRDEFGGFTGVNGNARVRLVRAPLRELAVLLTQALLALSNDTGPGHIAGALGVPTVTPYLPGNVYSMRVWSSTLWHRGVTLDPNPYSRQQVESAVLWGRSDIIDAIPPGDLVARALGALPAGYRVA